MTIYQESLKKFVEVGMNVHSAKVFPMTTLEEIEDAIKALPELDEGYVVFNLNTRLRVKIKSPRYIALHRLRGNGCPTWNNLAELVVQGETEEMETYFVEFVPLLEPIRNAMKEMLEVAQVVFDQYKELDSQKEFALAIKDQKFSSLMFTARKNSSSVVDAFGGFSVSQRVELVRKWMNVS